MTDLNAAKKHYLAGLVDADGCIRAGTRGIRVAVYSKQKSFIEYWHNRTDLGSVCGRKNPGPDGDMTRRLWIWTLSGKHCGQLLEQIAEFMMLKRAQAYLAIEFANTVRAGRGHLTQGILERRRQIREEIKTLNQLGMNGEWSTDLLKKEFRYVAGVDGNDREHMGFISDVGKSQPRYD